MGVWGLGEGSRVNFNTTSACVLPASAVVLPPFQRGRWHRAGLAERLTEGVSEVPVPKSRPRKEQVEAVSTAPSTGRSPEAPAATSARTPHAPAPSPPTHQTRPHPPASPEYAADQNSRAEAPPSASGCARPASAARLPLSAGNGKRRDTRLSRVAGTRSESQGQIPVERSASRAPPKAVWPSRECGGLQNRKLTPAPVKKLFDCRFSPNPARTSSCTRFVSRYAAPKSRYCAESVPLAFGPKRKYSP